MERLQLDVHDYLAARIVPKLLAALNGTALSTRERQAANALRSWNGGMDGTSTAASVWWSFWDHYLHATFDPWWQAAHVPSRRFHSVEVGSQQTSLDEDLEAWTVRDANNPAFSLPNGKRRSAPEVMRVAFVAAVRSLSHLLGPKVDTWRWARLHSRRFPSLAEIPSLGYGPRGNGGDPWTVDAADGGLTSEQGPSWRFVMDWGSGRAYGVYPGGQAENPVSSWYETGVPVWWAGRYFQLVGFESASAFPGSTKWSLRPSP
jgi:penicillin amidase